MTTATASRPEWYGSGGVMPEVDGTGSGPEMDFVNLAERCAAGNWPSKDEGHRILHAAGRSVPDLVSMVATLRRTKTPEPVPVAMVAQPAHRKPREINVAINNPAPVPRVANVNTIAQDKKERTLLQELEDEFTAHQELIARMGVDKLAYIQSRMRTELVRRGIDPHAAGLGQ